jgi:two-component system, NarL family, sensor histidine kinase UhpB
MIGVAVRKKQNRPQALKAQDPAPAGFMELARAIPAMVFQLIQPQQGECIFTFVNSSSQLLLGLTSSELMREPKRLAQLLLEEDRLSFHESRATAAELGTIWNWEGRIRLSDGGDIKWINVRAAPTRHSEGFVVWNGIATNITGSKVASVELNRARKRLQVLAVKLERARDEERAAIARELHDDLGAVLTALKINASWLQRLAPARPEWPAKVAELDELVDRGADTMRRIASQMRHAMLDYGMRDAFEWQTKDFSKRTGIACALSTNADNESLRSELATVLFRLLQEALTNVSKHAQATAVQVRLWLEDGQVELAVRDDGKGFTQRDVAKSSSFGLRNAQEYAEIMGGALTLRSMPGGGTLLNMRIPLQEVDELGNTSRFQVGLVGAGKHVAVLPLTMTQPMMPSPPSPTKKSTHKSTRTRTKRK